MIQANEIEASIAVPGGHLAAYSIGEGPAVIFLHGGPGDTHDYMKRMAEPLYHEFRCIFFDQRGTGRSINFKRNPEQFSLKCLFDDLSAVQDHFKADDAMLVGHSWGAMYALYTCIRHPARFRKVALLNMGPLDEDMEIATSEHLISVLNDDEKAEWQRLRRQRNMARDGRNPSKVEALDQELMRLRVKAWVFNHNLRESFLEDYFQDPPCDREINKWIWESQQSWFSWDLLGALKMPIWIGTGANDSVPIAQSEKIRSELSNVELTVFEECGHIPWLEHPSEFYSKLRQFLLNR